MAKKKQTREIKLGSLSPAVAINFYLNPEVRMPGGTKTHADYMDKARMKAILNHCIDRCYEGKAPASSKIVMLASAWLSNN